MYIKKIRMKGKDTMGEGDKARISDCGAGSGEVNGETFVQLGHLLFSLNR